MVKKFAGAQIIVFFFIILISYSTVQNPFSVNYIDGLKEEAVTASKVSDPLFEEIKKESKKYEEKPIDAVVDKVWKAIPGYNGIEVDLEKSYEKMKQQGYFEKQKLVFKEVEPEIHLDDLPPAPIYKGNPEKPMVTLLVNVAWGNEQLPELLKIMNEQQVKSTYFLDGSWVKNNPKLAKMIVEEGHEIGNHAYSHPDMKRLSAARIKEELEKTNDVIYATLEVTPKWFAPPSGSYRQEVVEIADAMNMHTILWSVDTIDWRKPEPQAMVENVLGKVHPGAMILMHPTSSTAAGLEQLIIGLKAKGYQIGTVSHLMDESRLSFGVTLD
ncbi:polysaccharide deacetylase family protein [Bacillus alkalicellulosilyticus]|uniref:polysaccharide deacetylase family protein n=1 Tax=Alkalihalobacterium alkalicellulosilyticum TaxID=1912214 RepID=UPI00099801B4